MRADGRSEHTGEIDRLRGRVRRTDGVLTWLLCLLVIAGVGGAFLSAVAVRSTVLERTRLESHDRTLVTAVVEQSRLIPGGQGSPAERLATVRWRDADETEHTGRTTVPVATTDGVAVTVWADADGRIVNPPTTAADATAAAVLVGLLIGALVALLTWVLAGASSRWTARGYARCWEVDWDRVGPVWTAGGHTG